MTEVSAPSLAARLALREKPQGYGPVMYQKWRDLLFLHWEYDPAEIQKSLPPGLYVDTYEGKAYVGIVPFFMRDVRPRFVPNVPGVSNFMETNIRTYAYNDKGVAGVWFYSLDANQWLAVKAARTFFKLPYFYARMAAERNRLSGDIDYTCWRRGTGPALTSHFRYRGTQGTPHHAQPGTLEFFLVERYILFADLGQGRLMTGQVHHHPYPLCLAEVSAWDDHLLTLDGLRSAGRDPDHILVSPGVDVDIFALTKA
jgi:uncharacterized protein